jgi:hypothetical protein
MQPASPPDEIGAAVELNTDERTIDDVLSDLADTRNNMHRRRGCPECLRLYVAHVKVLEAELATFSR